MSLGAHLGCGLAVLLLDVSIATIDSLSRMAELDS